MSGAQQETLRITHLRAITLEQGLCVPSRFVCGSYYKGHMSQHRGQCKYIKVWSNWASVAGHWKIITFREAADVTAQYCEVVTSCRKVKSHSLSFKARHTSIALEIAFQYCIRPIFFVDKIAWRQDKDVIDAIFLKIHISLWCNCIFWCWFKRLTFN